MVTTVGMQADFASAVRDLIELDYDAIEAYEAAINRIENSLYQEKLREFKSDHERHVTEFTEILKRHQEEPPAGPSAKQWLAKGKVIIGGLMGDEAILAAMKSNEEDTNSAYERMNSHPKKWEDALVALQTGLEDEKRHKAWIELILAD